MEFDQGYDNQGQSRSRTKETREESIIPFMISDLQDIQQKDKMFYCDEVQLDKIKLVGKVVSINNEKNMISIELDDGTGQVNVVALRYGQELPNSFCNVEFQVGESMEVVINVASISFHNSQKAQYMISKAFLVKEQAQFQYHKISSEIAKRYRKGESINEYEANVFNRDIQSQNQIQIDEESFIQQLLNYCINTTRNQGQVTLDQMKQFFGESHESIIKKTLQTLEEGAKIFKNPASLNSYQAF